MDQWEEIKLYLPKYLSAESVKLLLSEIEMFPNNIDHRLYIDKNRFSEFLQGDGVENLKIFNLPSPDHRLGAGIILSNSCDSDPENKKIYSSRVLYAPIAKVSKYIALLENNNVNSKSIQDHLDTVKKQSVTQLFYLPKGSELEEDHIAFLDHIISIPQSKFYEQDSLLKKFTLSDYGFYLFLFKISIHFTRIQEAVAR